jgi:2-polyprenyl-3-methyl-5-hydroxy-6-metoxy-1,4-benzoquinol methylase
MPSSVNVDAAAAATVEQRARLSLGTSHDAIYRMVRDALDARGIRGGRLVDVGCGSGSLWPVLADRFDRYCGLDAVRYDGFPREGEFHKVDLDAVAWPIGEGAGDVVAAVETIEHLENPWAFVRALVRIAVPGGSVVVTTPNQLSGLSVATLLVKRRFSAFQDAHYPAHRTALLESDLRRIAEAAGLRDLEIRYSHSGRLPLTPWHYPTGVARMAPRRLSDNLLIIGRRPRD